MSAAVHGGPFTADESHAFQYRYAYERLCDFTGTFLDNSCFMPFHAVPGPG
ncbi:DUF7691 family protein [Nonomuraea sp. CA-143628]|uniref:DUF7691 family protein n=1 Tax=Nonomuraea sp. CA-143628 TaxID=3239997 RepID=UPI003D91CACB